MKQKWLSMFLVLVLLCGIAGSAVAADAELRFSWWGADTRHGPYLKTFELYEELNPGVVIEPEYSGWDGYQEKLMTQLAGGQEPDIITLDAPWCPELANRGDYFVDFYEQDILGFSDIDQQFVTDFGEFNGKLIALPLGLQATVLLINKTVADQYGIDTEKEYTWEDLLEVGEKLHAENPDMYLLNHDRSIGMYIRSMLKQKSGNQVFNDDYTIGFSREDLLYAYNWLTKAYEVGMLENPGDAELFYGVNEQNPNWINGKNVMVIMWNGMSIRYASTLPEDTQLVARSYPVVRDNPIGGGNIVRPIFMAAVSKNSKTPDEALKFLNWFLNDTDAAITLASSKGVSSTATQMEAARAAGVVDPVVVEGLEYGLKNPGHKENTMSTNSELDSVFTDEVMKVAFGVLTPEQGVESTFAALESKLEQLKSK